MRRSVIGIDAESTIVTAALLLCCKRIYTNLFCVLQFKQNLTHAALMHKAGQSFATHRPCSTAQAGLGLAGFECIMLALLAVSVPVMFWRRGMTQ